MMYDISSNDNPQVKKVVSLHTAKGRALHNLFLAEGIRTCSTILTSPLKPTMLYTTHTMQAEAQNIVALSGKHCPITVVADHVMEKMSSTMTPPGLLLTCAIPTSTPYQGELPAIALEQINDPGNMGTIIRTAIACNLTHIIRIGGADVWSPKVVMASAGLIGHITTHQMTIESFVQATHTIQRCALVTDQTAEPIESIKANKTILIIGNEAHGISEELLSYAHTQATIRMAGPAESLNAAVATSIAMYQTMMK